MAGTKKIAKNKKKSKATHIHIMGARSNNLKDIEVKIPKNELVVVTGLSGSGKSSLVMDTLYAEGQRRYVESLSSYARQFLVRMKKPDVDFIKGLCPAIAVEQRTTTSNARSTVGSMTEIYDYLRLLFARIGKTYSPISGDLVKRHTVTDVVDFMMKKKKDTRFFLFVDLPKKYKERTLEKELILLQQKGYTRVKWKGELTRIDDVLDSKNVVLKKKLDQINDTDFLILIDRFVVNDDEENRKRMADSVQVAFYESEGDCVVEEDGKEMTPFNNRFELDGMTFLEPSHQLFNYNNSYGACPKCEGYGRVMGIDDQKVFPRPNLSVYDKAIACWSGEKSGLWLQELLSNAHHFNFPVHTPVKDLSKEDKKLLWKGNKYFKGIDAFFAKLEAKTYKIQNRVMLARYRGRTTCGECGGGRLRQEAGFVKINDHAIMDWIDLPIDELVVVIKELKLSKFDQEIAERILIEVNTRLETLCRVGLGYLSLNRLSGTLSGGESQRIHLTRLLGSNLTNSLYILDEPSIGLHPRDTVQLLGVLRNLRDLGNTVVVVEHEEEIIRGADHIIDIGPLAGRHGGDLIFSGPVKDLIKKGKGLTADYLTGRSRVEVRKSPRKVINRITIKGAAHNNLKDIDVTIPLNCLSVISGVSGSGKSTLIRDVFYRGLKKHLGQPLSTKPGTFDSFEGDLNVVSEIEYVSQSPIGKSSRSNPVTYVKAYDAIRKLFSQQQLSKIRGYEPKHFSFNVDGGRCDTCKGDGEVTVEMQFLADVSLLCEECKGARFKKEILDVKVAKKSISDILSMTIEEAIEFFEDDREIYKKIKPLFDVGLGYVQMGQSSSTLSGGEAQRVKLASFLNKDSGRDHICFIFDEPTTGLHFDDVNKLLYAMNALVEHGHTVIVIEHNMDIIRNADWLIDLGPEGGKAGGNLVYQGPPEGVVKVKNSYTGQFLAQ